MAMMRRRDKVVKEEKNRPKYDQEKKSKRFSLRKVFRSSNVTYPYCKHEAHPQFPHFHHRKRPLIP